MFEGQNVVISGLITRFVHWKKALSLQFVNKETT